MTERALQAWYWTGVIVFAVALLAYVYTVVGL
jgi:hypothetical protein